MNIGMVSTWFERGAAYVTKAYMMLLADEHHISVYARGGERYGRGDSNWDLDNVTWGRKLLDDGIHYPHFKKWIRNNNIEVILFNEQGSTEILHKIKKDFPKIKLGAYIDYYKEHTVVEFNIYDFLICNTKRHYSVFKNHPQCYYVPWGTDIQLFKPNNNKLTNKLVFFHSAGMSVRKGTEFVIEAFIEGEIYKKAKLIVHSQRKLENTFGFSVEKLKKYNIEVIEKTVTAPGLYYLADVYVYPTKLDGLGLTMYESLSSGVPVITTDHPPMNEIINEEVGYLVDVDYFRSRKDAYYWPLSIIDKNSLIKGMKYFLNNRDKLEVMKDKSRKEAVEKWNWKDRQEKINDIFVNSDIIVYGADKSLLTNKSRIDKINSFINSSVILSYIKKMFF